MLLEKKHLQPLQQLHLLQSKTPPNLPFKKRGGSVCALIPPLCKGGQGDFNNMNLEIYNETNTETPDINFFELRNKILGNYFDLTISILNPKNSQKINKKQRKMDYVPNTLSFKYSPTSGEIVMTPEVIDSEDYALENKVLEDYNEKFLYLTIHSMLHLTDLDHSEEMEELEEKYFK